MSATAHTVLGRLARVRILALTHGDNVGPGVFEDAVRAAGHELVERNVARAGVRDDPDV